MRNKKIYYITAIMITASILSLSGCRKNEAVTASTEPINEEIEELEPIEESEPEPITEPETAEESEPIEESGSVEESEPEEDLGYTITDIEPITLYATQACNIRSGPSIEYDIVNSLSYAQEVTAIGKVEKDGKIWFVLSTSGESSEEKQMVSGGLLSESKPQPVQQQQPSGGSSQQQQPSGSTDSVKDYVESQGWTFHEGGEQDFGGGGGWQ